MRSQGMEPNTCDSSQHLACSPARRLSSMVSAATLELTCVFSAFLFAMVFSTLGAVAGAIGGLQTRSGFLQGITVGAILGFTLSTQISALTHSLWDSEDFALGFFLPLIETTSYLLRERLPQHRPDAGDHRVLRETDQVENVPIEPIQSSRVRGSSKSSSRDLRDKIPRTILTPNNIVHTLWNGGVCTICLQEYKLEETVCCLPRCSHVFHSSCIRRWLNGHKTCPLCRKHL